MLHGKKILLGVCGSIAAYKSAPLTRLLVKSGAEVKIIMTASAVDFITPLTLSTLSRNPVFKDFQDKITGAWNSHVDLGHWPDVFLIAPASANTLSKFAHGICDNLLTATYLSATCPVFIAPAMDKDMYQHPSTQTNIQILKSNGIHIIEPDEGELASGLSGPGRMSEPDSIIDIIREYFNRNLPLSGKKILITAGPTYEAIDPVRYIGNLSSGKMGFALAETVASKGARVKLIAGPTHLKVRHKDIEVFDVVSAQEMLEVCLKIFRDMDIAILAAAVADYRPANPSHLKIKKKETNMNIQLEKTPDIARELGKMKKETQFFVGFALETDNEIENARQKLNNKNFDLIVLNSLKDPGAGFSHDTNKITIIEKNGKIHRYDLKPKKEAAEDICQVMIDLYDQH